MTVVNTYLLCLTLAKLGEIAALPATRLERLRTMRWTYDFMAGSI
jgi:hypothetical protein